MKNKLFLGTSLLIFVLLSPAISFADADKIFKENSKAVVVIVAYDQKGNPINQGSGFIVRQDGAIITNYHVISNARDIAIKAGDKVLEVEGLLNIDKENDIVILKAKGKNLPVLKISGIGKMNVGEKVYVISSPQGFENTISDGILSGIREIDSKRKILQITAPVSSGSSGGPVFNKDGEVIGIATFIMDKAQNLNFAMPVDLIKDKIESKKVTALKDSMIEDYEKSAEYWFYLGYYYGEAGMHKEAIEAYKQAIKINRNHAFTFWSLGLAYERLDMDRDAIEAFKQTIRIKPDHAYAYLSLGISYGKLGIHKEALEAYKQAIKIEPENAFAHWNLGIGYGNLGMYKEAVEAFKLAIRLKPIDAKVYRSLGDTYNKLRMYKEAIEAYKQSIRINPDEISAYIGLGFSYDELRMYKEAIEAFKQAIKIDPDCIEAYVVLGIAYVDLGMYNEAIESYKQAIRIKPDYAYAHKYLGIAYLLIGNRGMALQQYKILKELDPEKAEELFNFLYK